MMLVLGSFISREAGEYFGWSSFTKLENHPTLGRGIIDQAAFGTFFWRYWKVSLMFILGPRSIHYFYPHINIPTRGVNQWRLYSLISRVEKSLHVKEYTLAIFLDIEGAFNIFNSNAVARALDSLNLDQYLVWFTELLLNSRIITSTVAPSQCQRIVCRGTPQGGNNAIGYANYIVITASRLKFDALYQGTCLARCRYWLFSSTTLFSLTKLSSLDVKNVASFIKLSGCFSSRDCVHLWHHNGFSMRSQLSSQQV